MENDRKKGAPVKLVIIWLTFISSCTLMYAHLPNGWNNGAFAGVTLGVIAACNICYRKGYEEAEKSNPKN